MNKLLKTLLVKSGVVAHYTTANTYKTHLTLASAIDAMMAHEHFDFVWKHEGDSSTIVAGKRRLG